MLRRGRTPSSCRRLPRRANAKRKRKMSVAGGCSGARTLAALPRACYSAPVQASDGRRLQSPGSRSMGAKLRLALRGLTPQVGFTRLAALNDAELGQARVSV